MVLILVGDVVMARPTNISRVLQGGKPMGRWRRFRIVITLANAIVKRDGPGFSFYSLLSFGVPADCTEDDPIDADKVRV